MFKFHSSKEPKNNIELIVDFFCTNPLSEWFKKGIISIKDVLTENGNFLIPGIFT